MPLLPDTCPVSHLAYLGWQWAGDDPSAIQHQFCGPLLVRLLHAQQPFRICLWYFKALWELQRAQYLYSSEQGALRSLVWKGSKDVLYIPSLGKIQSSCMLAIQLTYVMLVWLIIYDSICFGAALPLEFSWLTIISVWFILLLTSITLWREGYFAEFCRELATSGRMYELRFSIMYIHLCRI